MAAPALKQTPVSIASSWIRANAGSGKTTALVERVVALLLRGVSPERICCITYTKAAAAEMQTRILHELRQLLLMDEASCRTRLEHLLGAPPTDEQTAISRRLFARVLDSPFGGLQLTTIHGFCQQLLRRFPLEAGLSPQFTVMENGEGERLERLARQRLIDEAEGELAAALELLADRAGEHGFRELLKCGVADSVYWQRLHEAYPLPGPLRDSIYAAHRIAPGSSDETLCAAAAASLIAPATAAALRAALPQFTSKTEQKLAAILARLLETPGDVRALDDLCAHMLRKEDGAPKAASSIFTKTVPLRDELLALQQRCAELHRQRGALALAEESYAAALASIRYLEHYRQLKAAHQSLDYNDLITHTAALLETHSGWVMSKLDHRIDHLLVDEAQDTSAGQWRIVRILFDELLSEGGIGSGGVPRSLLVVGDEKQSIFSFQGADPQQFMAEESHFAERLRYAGQPLELRRLEASYRSAQAILTLVDAVGALPEVARALSAGGEPTRHIFRRPDRIGRVVLHPPGEKIQRAEWPPFTLPTQYHTRETSTQQLADRMAATIRGWLDEGRHHPGDILILLWRRQPFADALIQALEAQHIPVAGLDRLALAEHLAVRDCLAAIQWCSYSGDDLALAHLLRSPIIGMAEQTLEDLAFARPSTLWQQVQDHAPHIAAQLATLLEARHATPYDFLTRLLEVQGARSRFVARFGQEVAEVLDELKAQSLAMPSNQLPIIAAFADWLTRSGREVKRQQEGRGRHVRIMTVHGAKGLEAPVVMLVNPARLPDTARERVLRGPEGTPAIAFSDEAKPAIAPAKEQRKQALLDEYYRLLYVALTRAEEELHLFAAEPAAPASWYDMVAQAVATLPTTTQEGATILQDAAARAPRPAEPIALPPALPEWLHVTPPAAATRTRILSPSRLVEAAESEAAIRSAPGANIRGVRIHRVLQFLRADSDAAHAAQLLRLAAPDWDGETHAATLAQIMALHAAHGWLWAHEAYPEASIAGEVDGERYSGQVDRLIITPDEVIVVDYKTGAHIPADAAAVPESYRRQLAIYRALLTPIYQKPIKTALLYTSGPRLIWL